MSDVEKQRKKKEADAYRREEEHRAERRRIEQKEREREKRTLDRRHYDEQAMKKINENKFAEMLAAEKKQDALMDELEQKKFRDAVREAAERSQAPQEQ